MLALVLLSSSHVNGQAPPTKPVQIIEWGTIGEVKPFITRQLTIEEYEKRNVLRLEYQVRCRCSCGYCCCRLCPIEVLHEELYAVHSRRTFLYGPPVECWTAEAPQNGDELVHLRTPLTYFTGKNSLDDEVLRLQATVRDPDEGSDPADSQLPPEKLAARQSAWGRNRIWVPAGNKLALIWNIHNDLMLPSGDTLVTFTAPNGVDVYPLKHADGAHVPCEDLNVFKKSAHEANPVELRKLSRVLFIANAEVPYNKEDLVKATWAVQKDGKPVPVTVSAPFTQIRDNFKIDREFRAIRTYSRSEP